MKIAAILLPFALFAASLPSVALAQTDQSAASPTPAPAPTTVAPSVQSPSPTPDPTATGPIVPPTPAPTTSAPGASAPTTVAPVTPAPTTPGSTTDAPATPAPSTSGPVTTPAPTPAVTAVSNCTDVSVEGDATFCISGRACSGSGPEPSSWKCPMVGDVAVDKCYTDLESYDKKSELCVAPVNAKCAKVKSGAWGCVWDLPTQPGTTPAPSVPKASCTDVSVEGDATYCIVGPICSGSGEKPVGSNCPKIGDQAVADCLKNLKSYTGGGKCVAPVNAACKKIKTGAWGCVWDLSAPVTPAPSVPTMPAPTTTEPVTPAPTTTAPTTTEPVTPALTAAGPTSTGPATPPPTTAGPVTLSPTGVSPVSPPTPAATTTVPVAPASTSASPATPQPPSPAPATGTTTIVAPTTPAPTTPSPSPESSQNQQSGSQTTSTTTLSVPGAEPAVSVGAVMAAIVGVVAAVVVIGLAARSIKRRNSRQPPASIQDSEHGLAVTPLSTARDPSFLQI